MLRLPSFRGQLQMLWHGNIGLEPLCEAYEDATTTLDRLRKSPKAEDASLAAEYCSLCEDLETDVLSRCLDANTISRPS